MTESPYSGKDTAAYIAAVDALVADYDPLEVLKQTNQKLANFFADKPEKVLTVAESNGKWSMRNVVDHLFDVELIYGYRVRMILASDTPRFLDMDQDKWIEQSWYRGVSLSIMLEAIGQFRRVNVAMLSGLTPQQKERHGIHSKRGAESVADLMRRWAGHDLLHLLQLERIWKTIGHH